MRSLLGRYDKITVAWVPNEEAERQAPLGTKKNRYNIKTEAPDKTGKKTTEHGPP